MSNIEASAQNPASPETEVLEHVTLNVVRPGAAVRRNSAINAQGKRVPLENPFISIRVQIHESLFGSLVLEQANLGTADMDEVCAKIVPGRTRVSGTFAVTLKPRDVPGGANGEITHDADLRPVRAEGNKLTFSDRPEVPTVEFA